LYITTIKISESEINAGSVANGIVNLKLPNDIPTDFLEYEQLCDDEPEDFKIYEGRFELIDNNGNNLGRLRISYQDEQIAEEISYIYFSKTIKRTCKWPSEDGGFSRTINVYVKSGWNKVYFRDNVTKRKSEISTNNILTKEVKWVLIRQNT